MYIKVGQIFGVSKNGSWALVDTCNTFFVGHELEHAEEGLEMCQKVHLGSDLLEGVGHTTRC